MSVRAAAALAALLALTVAPARAPAEVPRIQITVHPCVRIKQDLVTSLVGVELKGHVSASGADVKRVGVEVRCLRGEILIEIDDEEGVVVASRTLNLGPQVKTDRPRVLALTIAEMVAAIWETPPAPVVPEAPARPADPRQGLDAELPPPTRRAVSDRLFDVAVRASTRKFSLAPFQWGGSIRGAVAFDRRVVAEADFAFERGTRSYSELGDVAGTTYSVGVWGGLRLDLDPVELRGGVGLRGGAANISGSPGPGAQAHQVTGALLGPMIVLATRWLIRSVLLELSADFGLDLLAVRGVVLTSRGETEVSIGGPWFGIQLGVGYRL